jgi:predicted nucleotidyltransferase
MRTGDIPTLEALRDRRSEIEKIARRRGAHNLRVFGSVARGDARENSDVDFLVDFEPGRTVLDLSELILDLEEALGRPVDVVRIREPSPLAERILAQAVSL